MYSGHFTSFVVILCWLTWIGYWAATWRQSKPVTQRQSDVQKASYTVLLMAGFIFALADTRTWTGLGIQLIPYSVTAAGIGAFLCVLGVALTIWARRVLAGNWSSDVAFRKGQELVTRGPYAITRHPIYTGLTAMFVGTALVQGTLAAAVAIGLGFVSFWIKLRMEEALMAKQFGPDYQAYARRTKRIIPFVL